MPDDAPKRPMGLLAAMVSKPGGGEVPSSETPIPDEEPALNDPVPEPKLLAAESVASALRGGGAEDISRALDRYLRVCRYMED